MSIGRRLIDLAKSELNSLLDKAATRARHDEDEHEDEDLFTRYSLDQISDEELEAELDRRRRGREEASRQAQARSARPRPQAPPRSSGTASARPAAPPDEIRAAYAALEVPYGSNFETVRKSYRNLMRKYHPDRHVQSPEKQKAANELAQKLTAAYKRLDKHLRR